MASKDYLKLRGHTWYAQVSIPARLRKAARGKSEYIQSLKTSDLNEANRLQARPRRCIQARIASLERKRRPTKYQRNWRIYTRRR